MEIIENEKAEGSFDIEKFPSKLAQESPLLTFFYVAKRGDNFKWSLVALVKKITSGFTIYWTGKEKRKIFFFFSFSLFPNLLFTVIRDYCKESGGLFSKLLKKGFSKKKTTAPAYFR
jgi:hypothetical protein